MVTQKTVAKPNSLAPHSATSSEHLNKAEVLVLYTGGTIGMKNTNKGYCPAKNFLPSLLKKSRLFHDPSVCIETDYLISPPSFVGKRIYYRFLEYDPLLDSSNMSIADYVRIAEDIYSNYKMYDAFIVLHGTDTMAYTASALSFMLENLGKPIVLTGSQVPMSVHRNDGRENFFGALTIAGHYIIPEVLLFFDQKLFRGNRTTKFNALSYDAFKAPNSMPLATLGVKIDVRWDAVFRSSEVKRFSIFTDLDPNVGVLRLFPGITTATIKHFLAPPMRGVVLQTYGTGNVPDSRDDLISLITEAVKREILIVNCSQCSVSRVESIYATGSILERAGVIGGGDMTVEAALAKLYYVLGKPWNFATKRKKMSMCLRGEITQFTKSQFKFNDTNFISAIATALGTCSGEEVHSVKQTIYPVLCCGAANNGDLKMLRSLKESGIDMSAGDYDGRTPLHLAAANGDLSALKLLLSWGASVHATDHFGNNALMEAIGRNHIESAKLLVMAGSQIRIPPAKLAPLLCNYVAEGKVEQILLYHRGGADVFVGDYDSRTAIHIAASHGKKSILKLLIKIAMESDNPLSKINILDAFSNPPITGAIRNRHAECVQTLVEAGAVLEKSLIISQELNKALNEDDRELLQLFSFCGIVPEED